MRPGHFNPSRECIVQLSSFALDPSFIGYNSRPLMLYSSNAQVDRCCSRMAAALLPEFAIAMNVLIKKTVS